MIFNWSGHFMLFCTVLKFHTIDFEYENFITSVILQIFLLILPHFINKLFIQDRFCEMGNKFSSYYLHILNQIKSDIQRNKCEGECIFYFTLLVG